MTLQGIYDAKHWRDCAAEMRMLSDEMKDFEARTLMLKLANDYDKLADRAEARAAHDMPGPSPMFGLFHRDPHRNVPVEAKMKVLAEKRREFEADLTKPR